MGSEYVERTVARNIAEFTSQRTKSYMLYEGTLRKQKQLKQKILFLNLDVKERRDIIWKLGREQGNTKVLAATQGS